MVAYVDSLILPYTLILLKFSHGLKNRTEWWWKGGGSRMVTVSATGGLVDFQSLSPSSRAVLSLLIAAGPMTPTEIVESVGFASRTVRYALKDLLARDLVDKRPFLPDMRRTVYQVKTADLERLKAQILSQQKI
ncbi:MAG: winged helix-turn-helix transcriptional regulator [Candidatus Hodarchaeota archaeon]